MLFLALITVVIAFFYVSSELSKKQELNDAHIQAQGESIQVKSRDYVEEGSVPLRDLPMSDSQKNIVETMGIDVETYVITPEAIDCVKEKLGEDRVDEIINGAAPSVWESTKMFPCL